MSEGPELHPSEIIEDFLLKNTSYPVSVRYRLRCELLAALASVDAVGRNAHGNPREIRSLDAEPSDEHTQDPDQESGPTLTE